MPVDLYRKIKKRASETRNRDIRQKLELFLLALRLGNVTEACSRRGFSRKFYYKWWNRFRSSDFTLSALEEKTRRPKHSPKKTPQEVERAIRYYSRRKYGARMIQALLVRQGMKLTRATICHILNGRKKTKKTRRERLKTHQKRYELVIPGQRLQMDVKYVPYLVDGKKTYTYVIIDECTRWRFARSYDQLSAGQTVFFLNEVKKACPFPMNTIQTDNGHEFTYKLNPIASHLEHPVDRWCKYQGIRHRLIPPGVKELNGKVERSHRIDEQYFYWKAPTHDLEAFNRALSIWITFYNTKRLHGGLGYLTPLEKLKERSHALLDQPLASELEEIRIKFVKALPIGSSVTKLDRQISRLEKQLKSLLKAA